jgi:hypothetical protein
MIEFFQQDQTQVFLKFLKKESMQLILILVSINFCNKSAQTICRSNWLVLDRIHYYLEELIFYLVEARLKGKIIEMEEEVRDLVGPIKKDICTINQLITSDKP